MGSATVRVMGEADVPWAIELTAPLDWGYAVEDFRRLMFLGPEGCLVAEADGARAGIATVTTYGEEAWIGAVAVDERLRRRGLGTLLMEAALEFCDRCGVRSVRLNSYAHTVEFYRRLGFRGETENVRLFHLSPQGTVLGRAVPVEDPAAAAAFDAPFFGHSRERLLRRLWAENVPLYAAVRDDRLLGYAAGIAGDGTAEIGPMVVAPGESVAADVLLQELLGYLPRARTSVTVPVANAAAVEHLTGWGFEEQFRTVRMTRGAAGRENLLAIWALAGLEKG